MEKKCCSTRICSPALGVAFGLATGIMMMLFAWAGWLWHIGVGMIEQYAAVYHGYAPTFVGGLFGLLWGVIDGFIFGLIAGWIYNCCARCCHCAKSCPVCNDKKTMCGP